MRRKNFIPADAFPYTTAGTLVYDSGNYQGTLDKALEMVDYADLPPAAAAARQQGRYLGLGLSTYVEVCGLAPSPAAGAMGFQGGLWEPATVRMLATGKVVVYTGTNPHGQGEETTFAQIVGEELGVPVEDVDVDPRRHRRNPDGLGHLRQPHDGGRRHGDPAWRRGRCSRRPQKLAAHLLEAAPEDIVFDHGNFYVAGQPGQVARRSRRSP